MMMIVMIMMEFMMMFMSEMTIILMIAIMTRITIISRLYCISWQRVRPHQCIYSRASPHRVARRLVPKRVLCPSSKTRDLARILQPYVTTSC
jgi:hypothetical protein